MLLLSTLTRAPGVIGGYTFTTHEIRAMRAYVVREAGHGALSTGEIGEASAAWIEQHYSNGVAGFLARHRCGQIL